jgi:hypothetical protein
VELCIDSYIVFSNTKLQWQKPLKEYTSIIDSSIYKRKQMNIADLCLFNQQQASLLKIPMQLKYGY